jgi:hypothetical protein
MAKTRKKPSVKGDIIDKELAAVDQLFRKLDTDKSLPTFGQHFMYCLIFGIARRVDLQKLYPKTYKELSAWLTRHNQRILAIRKDR